MHYKEKLLIPAVDFYKAQEAYDDAFNRFESESGLMEDAKFWKVVDYFRNNGIDLRFDWELMKHSTEEFARKVRCGYKEVSMIKVEDLILFFKTYCEKVGNLYKPLFGIVKNRGDDAYGDLLDTFPLLGEDMYNKAINKKFRDNDHMEAEICNKVNNLLPNAASGYPTASDGKKLVYIFTEGENYFQTSLGNSIKEALMYECWESDRTI